MTIEKTSYRHWPNAYRCTVGAAEMIVVTTIGPRIMSLRLEGGENLLYEDGTDFRVGTWRLYGGHRFTTAPESDASYTPDNDPCETAIKGDHLLVRERLSASSGLLRELDIGPAQDHTGFELQHILRNCGSETWHGAPWAITCVNPGQVVIPLPGDRECFWSQAGQQYAGASSRQWRRAKDHFVVEPTGEKGKVGLWSEHGWLSLIRAEATFVIRSANLVQEATYPDGGCNVEVYTCANFLELETLGPLSTLEPGQELCHSEWWHVVPETFEASDWPLIDRVGRADSGLK